jgi:hypothetical protein
MTDEELEEFAKKIRYQRQMRKKKLYDDFRRAQSKLRRGIGNRSENGEGLTK